MCGIIAYTGSKEASSILIDGLHRLEYRGYDSAGIALVHRKRIRCWKAAGKISMLEQGLPETTPGHCGIGHTRWATHGAPTDANAHPHTDTDLRIAVAHNGIIENADSLRAQLIAQGVTFSSETDSEVLAHLLAAYDGSLIDAMRTVLPKVQGTYGLAAIDRNAPDTIVVARLGSPVILGIGENEMLAASDMSALARHTQEIVHLDDGEVAELSPRGFHVTTMDARPSQKSSTQLSGALADYDKGGYAHYLHREIRDQVEVVQRTLSGRLDLRFSTAHLGGLNLAPRDLLNTRRIKILGCGSAYYAGMAGAHMIEGLARLPVSAEPAAEFRYRNPVVEPETLYIVASQSGETFDTLAALREIRRKGGFVLGIVNSVGSTIAREVDGGIYMHAGPEVSVASTKAYTSMLTVFSLLALMLGRLRDVSPQRGSTLVAALQELPDKVGETLALEDSIAAIAPTLIKAHSAFFLGRTASYPVALEGAQKLKEISYIHAEAYPASELKHGPLALISSTTPCIVLLPDDELLTKSLTSLEEIRTRGAPIISLTDSNHPRIHELSDQLITLPAVSTLLQPIVAGIALQLLAYHCALLLERDIDQPRNLAKSVTVE
ncbi:glutamine--fructose-6-phosphate transaminase (isomerizing) [Granulosicoccus antarcticus]|uniref:Glutamine--fructose-6-phosphate aminotransferase [isomerizing] n=1 Tax=Granulosicoccus antarcticus IMCC3135 TaxID=1192854 RepID=A0A2Z2NVQ3_9GAMM|nr:glutamine--fructose-6-phosphate transaminase (isomerizing) [Granulosicoccus antarcticus]ASJ75419.1 Glutamine--fructose-6-phosphate aminotransferase (isomerizing) [Granulosicoccus antarcticus IMCC3135]